MKFTALFLAFAGVVCADNHRPDHKLPDSYPPLYNAPGSIELSGGWNVQATSSLIYWRVSQDYMDSGRSATFGDAGPVPSDRSRNIYPDFQYQPGFKVGLGVESIFDHWSMLLQYTWLHQKTTHSTGSVPEAVVPGDKIYISNDWFNTLAAPSQSAKIENSWKMHLDQLDLLFSNPFYEGPSTFVYHYGGFRGLWIRQNYTVRATLAEALDSAPAKSVNWSQNWSLGPMVGIAARSLLKWGLRVEGVTKFALLYTRYIKLSHTENDQGLSDSLPVAGSMAQFGCLRPISEFGIGAGWGSYLGRGRYHIDLSARYDFNILWNQNMLRQLVGSLNPSAGYGNAIGHLYLGGLTVDASINF